MAVIRITQRRSGVSRQEGQRRTLFALGLRKIGDSVVRQDRPEIRGMIAKVAHLVTVEPIEGSAS